MTHGLGHTVYRPHLGFWPLSWDLFMLSGILFKLHKQAFFLVMIESWGWSGLFLLNSHYVSHRATSAGRRGEAHGKQRFPVKTAHPRVPANDCVTPYSSSPSSSTGLKTVAAWGQRDRAWGSSSSDLALLFVVVLSTKLLLYGGLCAVVPSSCQVFLGPPRSSQVILGPPRSFQGLAPSRGIRLGTARQELHLSQKPTWTAMRVPVEVGCQVTKLLLLPPSGSQFPRL